MSGMVTITFTTDPMWSDALCRADKIVYGEKRREWDGRIWIDRIELRNLICDEIQDAVIADRKATKGAK